MTDEMTADGLAEMEQLLDEELLGYLGVLGPDGRPYVVPLNFAYARGRILFHCALEGRKLDAIRAQPRVCFTVARQAGVPREHFGDVCHLDSDSVVCLGRARIVDSDADGRAALLNEFNRRFRPDAPDIPADQVRRCAVVELALTEMTGRRERKRQRTLWRHVFEGA